MRVPIDEATIIAWVDGELPADEADRVADAVAADPALATLADRHRAMRARFAAAFAPLAQPDPVPVTQPDPAPVVSLAEARARRQARGSGSRRAWVPLGLAASLAAGVLVGQLLPRQGGIGDRAGALALAPDIADALSDQLSGTQKPVRIALSFRDHDGQYCRSFSARRLSGIACREGDAWQLRYGSAATAARTDYRMAGEDGDTMAAVTAMIDGDPLDRRQEEAARAAGWR